MLRMIVGRRFWLGIARNGNHFIGALKLLCHVTSILLYAKAFFELNILPMTPDWLIKRDIISQNLFLIRLTEN